MAVTSDFKRSDTLPRPQYFITRIIGGGSLPDYEFITLPTDRSLQKYTDEDVEEWAKVTGDIHFSDKFDDLHFFPIFQNMLYRAHGDLRALRSSPDLWVWLDEFAHDIYESQPLPIMQSPLTGKTLQEIVKAAGGGVAFYSIFPHPGPGEIAIFFLLLGGTRIILGASDGIAFALKHGLSHLLLKWMGVPQPKIPPIKEKD